MKQKIRKIKSYDHDRKINRKIQEENEKGNKFIRAEPAGDTILLVFEEQSEQDTMITYTLKEIDGQGSVQNKHVNVSDIQIYGQDIQIHWSDGSGTNINLDSEQRIELTLE